MAFPLQRHNMNEGIGSRYIPEDLRQDSKKSSGWALRYSYIIKGYLFVQELPQCKSFPQTT
jgi:hypothetical protein